MDAPPKMPKGEISSSPTSEVKFPVHGRRGGSMRVRSDVDRVRRGLVKVPSESTINAKLLHGEDNRLDYGHDRCQSICKDAQQTELLSASSSNSSSWSLSDKGSHCTQCFDNGLSDSNALSSSPERPPSLIPGMRRLSKLSHCSSVPALPVACERESHLSSTEELSEDLAFVAQPLLDSCSSCASVLRPITTKQARQRSFLVGSIGLHGTLLGESELARYFPDQKIRVLVGTWNMNGEGPPDNMDDFLLPEDVEYVPDMYAIGVQEGTQDWKEWEITLQTTIGASHILFHSVALGVLHLAIFIRRDLMWFCSVPEDSVYPTRTGSMVKTKGAVAIAFLFFGTSFLFINCHLTAHEKKLKERIADYEKIRKMLDIPKLITLRPQYISKDVTARFDCVFWCGDFNFRLVRDRETILSFIRENQDLPSRSFNNLIKYDQLRKTMKDGSAFCGFQEGKINFAPSYKFDKGTDAYDTVKNRVPSYTDRVLYRCKKKGTVECLHYDSVPRISNSDHKPVYAMFQVKIRPGRDNHKTEESGSGRRQATKRKCRLLTHVTDTSAMSNVLVSIATIRMPLPMPSVQFDSIRNYPAEIPFEASARCIAVANSHFGEMVCMPSIL